MILSLQTERENPGESKGDEAEPKAERGKVYLLGSHRLMCGDSTDLDNVRELMGGDKVDLVLTDPPYNVNVSNSNGLTIENDNLEDEEFYKFLVSAFKCAVDSMKDGAGFYIWHGSNTQRTFENALNESGLRVRQQLIWVKNAFIIGGQDYQWKHEPCFYGWKEGSHYFCRSRRKATVIDDSMKLELMNAEELREIIKSIDSTVIYENRPKENKEHPTMKPISLMMRQIKNSTKKYDKVLDLFGGSGSTLIACEQLGRSCYMMEYDPKYVDVIIKRWEDFTGKKAVLLDEQHDITSEKAV